MTSRSHGYSWVSCGLSKARDVLPRLIIQRQSMSGLSWIGYQSRSVPGAVTHDNRRRLAFPAILSHFQVLTALL